MHTTHTVPYRIHSLLVYTFLPSSPVPTGPPQGLAVVSRTTTSITVTWRDPATDRINDRDGVTGFVVRSDGQEVATVTERTYTFTGLTVATSYRLEVLAVNDQGTAPNNHAARLTTTTASEGMYLLEHLTHANNFAYLPVFSIDPFSACGYNVLCHS